MRATSFYVILHGIFTSLNASAQIADQFNSWWYYSGDYQVSEKISVTPLYSWSRHDFVKNWQQSKLRVGAEYKYLKDLTFGGGYEWVILFPYGEYPIPGKRTEHRIYEQVTLKNKTGKVRVSTNILLEQRFLSTETRHRVRMKWGVKLPLINTNDDKPKLALSLYDQVLLNVGKTAKYQYFAQNRFYAGFDWSVHKSLTLSLGYMDQYIVIKDNKIENNHTLMVGFFHTIDLRNRKTSDQESNKPLPNLTSQNTLQILRTSSH